MDDFTFINTVLKKYTESELLDFILENPNFLTDSYYADFLEAIRERHSELRDEKLSHDRR